MDRGFTRSRPNSSIVLADDPRLTWEGIVSLQHGDGWVKPWRIPYADRWLFEAFGTVPSWPYGGRLTFESDAEFVVGHVEPFTLADFDEFERSLLGKWLAEATTVDLCCDGALIDSASLADADSFRFDRLPSGTKRLEIWLPQFSTFRLRGLELSPRASISRSEDPRPRWVAYGSSHLMALPPVAHPSEAWTGVVARSRGLNQTVLGYPGGCHLDPAIARMIRDLPVSFLSMEVALNAFRGASLSQRTYGPMLVGFAQTVRDKHPDIPIVVQSPIYTPVNDAPDSKPNQVGWTLSEMRAETARVVELLRAHGDRNVHYVDGLSIYGAEHAHLSPDGSHPNAEGQHVVARGFLREVVEPWFV